ncbi:MAG: dipeptide epimerase, partial [Gemmatimonadota bacterium]|nr:dipeptide epimerase [Gemmatimonadota bacterium]
MKLAHQTIELKPTHPFVIARGGYANHRNVLVRVTDDDGLEGFGEAAPNKYYGESVDSVIAALSQFKSVLDGADALSLESTEASLDRLLRGNASAKAAVSSALHDLVGKKLGLPVHRIWGLDAARAPQSSFTIAIAENNELERRVAEARDYPILKIKLGTDRDEEIVRIVRNAGPDKRLRVDANAGWTPKQAVRMSDFLADNGVEMLEQPVAANDIEGLR